MVFDHPICQKTQCKNNLNSGKYSTKPVCYTRKLKNNQIHSYCLIFFKSILICYQTTNLESDERGPLEESLVVFSPSSSDNVDDPIVLVKEFEQVIDCGILFFKSFAVNRPGNVSFLGVVIPFLQ